MNLPLQTVCRLCFAALRSQTYCSVTAACCVDCVFIMWGRSRRAPGHCCSAKLSTTTWTNSEGNIQHYCHSGGVTPSNIRNPQRGWETWQFSWQSSSFDAKLNLVKAHSYPQLMKHHNRGWWCMEILKQKKYQFKFKWHCSFDLNTRGDIIS